MRITESLSHNSGHTPRLRVRVISGRSFERASASSSARVAVPSGGGAASVVRR